MIRVQGTLTFEKQKAIEDKASKEIDRGGKVKLLVLAEQFSG